MLHARRLGGAAAAGGSAGGACRGRRAGALCAGRGGLLRGRGGLCLGSLGGLLLRRLGGMIADQPRAFALLLDDVASRPLWRRHGTFDVAGAGGGGGGADERTAFLATVGAHDHVVVTAGKHGAAIDEVRADIALRRCFGWRRRFASVLVAAPAPFLGGCCSGRAVPFPFEQEFAVGVLLLAAFHLQLTADAGVRHSQHPSARAGSHA